MGCWFYPQYIAIYNVPVCSPLNNTTGSDAVGKNLVPLICVICWGYGHNWRNVESRDSLFAGGDIPDSNCSWDDKDKGGEGRVVLWSTVDEGVLVSEGTDSVVEIKGEIFC